MWNRLILVAVVSGFAPMCFADDCDSILTYVKEHYEISTESAFRETCLELLNMQYDDLEQLSKQQSKKGSLALKIFTFGLAGGGSKENAEARWRAVRSKMSALGSTDVSSFESFYLQADVVSSAAVSAWIKCKGLRQAGLYGKFNSVDKGTGTLTLYYARGQKGPDRANVRSIKDGTNCKFVRRGAGNSEFELNSIPSVEGTDVSYTIKKIDEAKPAVVIVNTDQGSFVAVF